MTATQSDRRYARELLAVRGPMTVADLALALRVAPGRVRRVVAHPWFEVVPAAEGERAQRYGLSDSGRAGV